MLVCKSANPVDKYCETTGDLHCFVPENVMLSLH